MAFRAALLSLIWRRLHAGARHGDLMRAVFARGGANQTLVQGGGYAPFVRGDEEGTAR